MCAYDQNRPDTFVIEEWTVEPLRNVMARGDEEVRLEPRVMDVLVQLASRAGQVVTKEELVAAVWQGRWVTDEVLTVTICALRRALNDDARKPRYIETVFRRGYRWLTPVTKAVPALKVPEVAAISGEGSDETKKVGPRALTWTRVATGVAALVILAVACLWAFSPSSRKRHVPPAEAHEAYLKGRFFLDQRSIQGWRQALEQFERAAAVDPRDSSAQAGLADTYSAMSDFGVASPAEMRPRAFQSAERALELDGNSAEGYEALGRAQFLFDWDFAGAEHNLRHALSLNPDYMPAHQAMAWVKSAQGQYTEAVVSARLALQLDPVNTARYTELAWVQALSGKYDDALHEIDSALLLNPRSFEAYLMKGWTLELAGKSKEAFQAFYDGLRTVGVPEERLMRVEAIYRADGLPGYYRNWLEAQRRGSQMPMSSTWRAQLYVHAGQLDRALEALEEAYQKREGALAWVNVEPSFQALRSNPRFQVIAAQVGHGSPKAR